MLITSLSVSAENVTFNARGCWLVYKLEVGNTIVACPAGVFATVTICSLWLKLLLVSITIEVKLITLPLAKAMVKFCEHWSLAPLAVLLKNSFAPVWFITNRQVLNPELSVTFAVKLTRMPILNGVTLLSEACGLI